ncbi:hypothetical protein GPA27_05150 [Aromatoleum toluolicum]|uniref:Uncharacterized protein n=1 Tax=Aromatoleum toluolicum TaxID=90060 RepID=A0ABX1NBW5_9RHOO|nr:hypothetical protein [Aromatoleum toluolicum]NMF96771.1 hypothetical protein [Aromatoleum toluolicum]
MIDRRAGTDASDVPGVRRAGEDYLSPQGEFRSRRREYPARRGSQLTASGLLPTWTSPIP